MRIHTCIVIQHLPVRLIVASYSIPYVDKHYCLYDLDHHELVLNGKGQVRVFSNRASARGTRSRLLREKQDIYTASKGASNDHS